MRAFFSTQCAHCAETRKTCDENESVARRSENGCRRQHGTGTVRFGNAASLECLIDAQGTFFPGDSSKTMVSFSFCGIAEDGPFSDLTCLGDAGLDPSSHVEGAKPTADTCFCGPSLQQSAFSL